MLTAILTAAQAYVGRLQLAAGRDPVLRGIVVDIEQTLLRGVNDNPHDTIG